MEKYNLTQTGPEVQGILDSATPQSELTAETQRAQQAEHELQLSITDEENRAKAAERQNADDIDAIENKIPSSASSENKLATIGDVNDEADTRSGSDAALRELIDEISALIPETASALNQLADKQFVSEEIIEQIVAAIPNFAGQFTTLAQLQDVESPKAGDIGIVRTKDTDGHDVFTFYQYKDEQWNEFYSLSYHPQRKPASTGLVGDAPYNGMGRIELPMNWVEGWPNDTWLYYPYHDIVYLMYYWNGQMYAVYNAGTQEGLGLDDNLVVKPLDYNIADIQEFVGERYLPFTESSGVWTITKPDDSTITSTELNNTNIYKVNDPTHLGINVLTQSMLNRPNTIYVIQYDFTLDENITIPENCVLEFDGGSISGAYTITGNNTGIQAPKVGIFGEVSFAGTWDVPHITSEWIKDATEEDGIKQLINLTNDNVNNTIVIESGEYKVTVPESAHSIYGNAALDLKSNTTLIINGTIKLVNSPYRATTIIRIENKENVVITGDGKIVGNVESAPSVDAWPFAFGIWVIGKNVIVQNLEISECGGDAITVGTEIQEGFVHSENISISNMYIHDCNRQGISVIDADNVKISNNTIDNIEGVSGAGCAIDIEMSYLWHSLKNIYITNNICINCFKAINAYDMSNSQREDKNPIKNIIVENNKADDLIIDIRHASITKIDNNLCRSIICGAISGLISNNVIIAENDIEHYQNNAGVIFTGNTSNLRVVNNTITSTYLAQATNDVVFENNTITVTKLFRNYNATVYRLRFKSNTIICKNLDIPYFYCIFDGNNITCESFEIGKFIYNAQEEITSCESYNNFLNNEIIIQNSSLINLKAGTKTGFINNSIRFGAACILKVYDRVYLENNTLVRTSIYVENENVFIKNNIFMFCLIDRFININADSVFVSNNIFDVQTAGNPMGLYIQKQNAKNIIIRENVCKGTNFGLVVNAASGNYSALTLLYNIKENNTTNYYYAHLLVNSTIELNYPKSGTTRPTNIPNNLPIQFFDTSLNPPKPIWWNGTAWVDSTGTPV